MSKTLRVLHVPRKGVPEIKTIQNTYEDMQGLIEGGWLLLVPLWGGLIAYCDEDGGEKYPDGFEFGLVTPHVPVPVGTAVTPLPKGGQVVSFTKEQFQRYQQTQPVPAAVGIRAPFFIVGPGNDEGGETDLPEDEARALLNQLSLQAAVRDRA